MRNPISSTTSNNYTPCCSKVGIKRGPWTAEEDEILSNFVKKGGEGKWRTLPKRAGLLRCGKSCRLRWMNYLRPDVKRGRIAPDEEDLILRLHRLLGNRWSLIAGRIPGRTDNEIKNYWNTHLSKKLISQGIDPRTHKPLNPTPSSSQAPSHDNNTNHAMSNPSSSHIVESSKNCQVTTMKMNENFTMANPSNVMEKWPSTFEGLSDMELLQGDKIPSNEEYIGNYWNDQETFSSLLDSFINENLFANQQLQERHHNNMTIPSAPVQPSASSSQDLDYKSPWGDELVASMARLGHADGAQQI